MDFQFDESVDRRNTGSMKWDVAKGELPMWVADMDFRTAPGIIEKITERATQGVFGYTVVTDEWYQSYKTWWKKRHDFDPERMAGFLYRCGARHFQHCPESYDRRGECCSIDSGL